MIQRPALRPATPHTDPSANQRAASNPRASVWVSASAGSGKTTVLTARVTRLLLEGVAPERLLCLTYTRAGAAEMTNRITKLFTKWVSCDDTALEEDFDKLQNAPPTPQQRVKARRLFAEVLSCPGGLRVRTIHSFCQEILSRFPIEAGLPPHFALIEGADLDELKENILEDLLEQAGNNPNDDLAHALELLIAEQGEYGFHKMLQEALKECGRLEESVDVLAARTRASLNLGPSDNAPLFCRRAMAEIPEASMLRMATWLCEDSETQKKRGTLLKEIIALPIDQRVPCFDDYVRLFLTAKLEPYAETSIGTKKIRDKHPEIITMAAQEATRLLSTLERIEAANLAEMTQAVLTFGAALSQRLAQAKATRAVLDYDDLITHTERLLSSEGIGAWIRYKLDQGIDHILVDEAQDTSRAQWNIVQALTREFYAGEGARNGDTRTLFVVGDEKQSIFSFQNADPEGFLSLREDFDRQLIEVGQKLERVPLHVSFRSAPAVLRTVDEVFAPEAVREGVAEEPVHHETNPKGPPRIGHVEIWPLLKPIKDEEGEGSAWAMPTEVEEDSDPQSDIAHTIARTIKGWIDRNEKLPGTSTPIRPGDIMILLRRRGRFADIMVRALKTVNVPVTGVDRMHLISQLAVMDLLAVIRFVLLPEDDLNLAALLRSPLIGISEEQLMRLAMGRSSKETLWDRVKNSSDCASIYVYLAARLSEADFITPFAFLAALLSQPCPVDGDSGRKALWKRLGEEALDPIEELLNAAQDFGRRHAPSLQNFLHWLTEADAEIKRELDHGDTLGTGQVRIMTVHASKGLEAPIVFLPDTAAVPRPTDMPKFQWHDDTPLFMARKPHFANAVKLWGFTRQKQLQEYRRLLYVALTRAVNRLYICGWQSRNDGEGNWHQFVTNALRPLHQSEKIDQAASTDSDIIVYADAYLSQPTAPQINTIRQAPTDLPVWARTKAASEILASRRAPSALLEDLSAATPDATFARGRIIHRLLQSLPEIAPANRAASIARFLAQKRHNLTDDQRDAISREVDALLKREEFAILFGNQSRAEVGLIGLLDGTPVTRQVDRLCLLGDEVWIVDYKTNRPPPNHEKDVPEVYRIQLAEYRTLLAGIYPDKKVRGFLLWTFVPHLMEITF